jgi:cell division protein FtsL
MKKIITSLLLFVSIFAFAQESAIADLKFEEAETAFNNQDYETTIKKLDEFDKLLGSIKDKSLYLRIISQDKLFDPTKLYENESQFNLLSSLRKNTNAYLKAMESSGLDERYREVMAINKKLENYPKDKKELDSEVDNLDNYTGIYMNAHNKQKITRKDNILYFHSLEETILDLPFNKVEKGKYACLNGAITIIYLSKEELLFESYLEKTTIKKIKL